jgi:hypothetical protein
MQENDEKWKELCAQAAVEQDPQRLSQLVNEIIRLIDLRKRHIANKQSAADDKPGQNGRDE